MKNTTYIKLDTFGDSSVRGWWWHNRFPHIEKYVVVEARRITTSRVHDEMDWLINEMGARMVHVIETE